MAVQQILCLIKRSHYSVSIETSGSKLLYEHEVAKFDCVIADLKCPSTEMESYNVSELYYNLRKVDFVKAVVQNNDDLWYTHEYFSRYLTSAKIALSPRYGFIQPVEIVEWMRKYNKTDWMLNLQMHKTVWPDSVKPGLQTLSGIDVNSYIATEV